MTKELRIYVREKETKADDKGKTRVYFEGSYTKDGDVFFQINFKQSCLMKPNKTGYWKLKVDTTKVSWEKMKVTEKGYKPNDILWIDECIELTFDEEYTNQKIAERQEEIDHLFD